MSSTDWQRIAATTWKPGQTARRSGQYAVLNRDGEPTGVEITLSKGETFPPSPEKGFMYQLADSTKHAHDTDAPQDAESDGNPT